MAERVAFLVDGEDYFRALKAALLKARHSILFLGWEIDSRTRLDRRPEATEPNMLGPLLDHVVRNAPHLQCHVLIWDSALIYSFDREFLPLLKLDWLTHPRLRFRLDDSHPLGASHHQKVIVIDDEVAFVGGQDVTSGRWDTRGHLLNDARRNDPGLPAFEPFHDIQALVSGPAAAVLGELARYRWRCATGQSLSPPPLGYLHDPWPEHVAPPLRNVPVAIARTSPPWEGEAAVREVEQLYLDMIGAARRSIYIENQYLASRRIAKALMARLTEDDCPEIVIVTPTNEINFMERRTMGAARARIVARLRGMDRRDRLRLYCPMVEGRDIKIHSKLMIVDDCMARVGSSNLNNRSMGLDTECDLLVEACGDEQVIRQIAHLRQDLLAEHLGCGRDEIAAAERREGGMIAAIEALRREPRSKTVVPLASPPANLVFTTPLLDPEGPVEDLVMSEETVPGPAKRPLARRVLGLCLLVCGLTMLGLLWRWAPLEGWLNLRPVIDWAFRLDNEPLAPAIVTLLFIAGSMMAVPVSLMILVTALIFGPVEGVVHSLLGAVASASLLYGVGNRLGRDAVRLLAGRRVTRVSRALDRRGMLTVALLRLLPISPFTVFNLVAGASHIRFRDFVMGTIVGMIPGIVAMSVFGDRLAAVLRKPDLFNVGVMAAVAAIVVAVAVWFANRLSRSRANTINTEPA